MGLDVEDKNTIDTAFARSVEVAIIGGGVAGMATALWCKRVGVSALILESSKELGGQLFWIHNAIPDYPGLPSENGTALAVQLTSHLAAHEDIETWCGVEVESVDLELGVVETSRGRVEPRAVVLATGQQRRKLSCEGEREWRGRGVYYSASAHREAFTGQSVVIVGGGDGAFENALLLADICPEIHVLYRGTRPSARVEFTDAVKTLANVYVHLEAEPVAFRGDEALRCVVWRDSEGTHETQIGAALVKIGLAPVVDLVEEQVTLDEHGYLCVDRGQRSSHVRLWAVGDVCTPTHPSIAVSVGQACIAAREIERALFR